MIWRYSREEEVTNGEFFEKSEPITPLLLKGFLGIEPKPKSTTRLKKRLSIVLGNPKTQ
jgi:hypothetical protein